MRDREEGSRHRGEAKGEIVKSVRDKREKQSEDWAVQGSLNLPSN